MTLATFLHISDLHIGLIDPDTFDAEANKFWALLPTFDGFLGHRHSSLVLLEKLFLETLSQESPVLIVTGDVTTNGDEKEFEIAKAYLAAEHTFPNESKLGLVHPDWKDWAIPGNHDHWPGTNWILGPTTEGFKSCFSPLPAVCDFKIASSKQTIRFLRVDTDADVSCYLLDRFFARGCFVSQLDELRTMTRGMPTPTATVLCLHHSPAERGYLRSVESKSRAELDKFIIEMEVSVLLSGHIHNPPMVKVFTAKVGSKSRRYLEARCGTTSQSDFFESPFYWRTFLSPLGLKPKRWSNSLLVHRIVERERSLYWETELLLQSTNDFQPPVNLDPEIAIEPSFPLS